MEVFGTADVEAEAVEASHLVRVPCVIRGCGQLTLAAPGQIAAARCPQCHLAGLGGLGRGVGVQTGGQDAYVALRGQYTVPVGYPLGDGPGRVEVAGVESYPAPEVSSRDMCWDAVSGAVEPDWLADNGPVAKLTRKAFALGWHVRVQYARGYMPHATHGRPSELRQSWAVRGWRLAGDVRRNFVAVRRGTGWDAVWMWGPGIGWFGAGSITDLGVYLADPMRSAGWFTGIKTREAGKAARAKERAAERPRKAKINGAL